MKRIVAIAMTMLLLLASVAASAESTAGALSLTDLSVSVVTEGRSKAVRLKGMSLSMILGSTEGIPTLQVSFDNGKGQLLDGVLQIVDTRLLISVGGLSGTYYIDLASITSREKGEMVAKAVGSTLALAGPYLDVLLYALTTENSNGMRTLEINLPDDMYRAVADSVFSIIEGLDAVEEIEVAEMHESMEESGSGAMLRLRYKPSSNEIEMAAIQNGKGVQLTARMELSIEETTFVNISQDELQYDLMNLDAVQMDELRGELDIIALKYGKFALGTGLGRLFR